MEAMVLADSFWGLLSKSVMSASVLEQAVLGFLVVLSILSWAVIIMKIRALGRMRRNNRRFSEAFEKAAHTGEVEKGGKGAEGPAPRWAVFSAGVRALAQGQAESAEGTVEGGHLPLKIKGNKEERVRLAMEHALKGEMTLLGRHLQVLATAGSASPFIGLFGTVWGIMATFQALGGAKSASLQVLAPPIAAALIATAAGLAVAIPAVMAYNWINARLDEEQVEATCLMERLLHLMRAGGAFGDTAPATAGRTA